MSSRLSQSFWVLLLVRLVLLSANLRDSARATLSLAMSSSVRLSWKCVIGQGKTIKLKLTWLVLVVILYLWRAGEFLESISITLWRQEVERAAESIMSHYGHTGDSTLAQQILLQIFFFFFFQERLLFKIYQIYKKQSVLGKEKWCFLQSICITFLRLIVMHIECWQPHFSPLEIDQIYSTKIKKLLGHDN